MRKKHDTLNPQPTASSAKRRVRKPTEEQLEPTSIAAIKKVMQDEVTKQFTDLTGQLNIVQQQNIYLATVVGKLTHAIAEIQTWSSLATTSNHGSARTTLQELASNIDQALQPIVSAILADDAVRHQLHLYGLVTHATEEFRRSMMLEAPPNQSSDAIEALTQTLTAGRNLTDMQQEDFRAMARGLLGDDY